MYKRVAKGGYGSIWEADLLIVIVECFKTIIDEYIPLFEQLADNAVLKDCFKTSGKDAGATY